jgi:2-polyprenyl-3-methyl-5-hydroxy-6-metoxy-1,4-benzoquinol methylase
MNETQPPAGIKVNYFEHLKSVNPGTVDEATYRASVDYYDAELRPLLPHHRNSQILDAGSGFGHLLRFCSEMGYTELHGVDLDPEICRTASAYLGSRIKKITCSDVNAYLKDHQDSFDLITMFDLIEHFNTADALVLLNSARGALRCNGRIVLRTPNMANILGAYSRFNDLTHMTAYTEYSLSQLLKLGGFPQPKLHLPAWTGRSKRALFSRINRWFHFRLIKMHDRTCPRCFEKNVVVWAEK